ncbi:MAG: hypothetical protein KGQ46_08570 [Hyphomicrobiales bacterium]|nr:hypothetical protein [Hyphomicrobiales bacterium]MDE2114806.1 hypothetical protein [Hyphomicrobiales bacterium]
MDQGVALVQGLVRGLVRGLVLVRGQDLGLVQAQVHPARQVMGQGASIQMSGIFSMSKWKSTAPALPYRQAMRNP